MEPAVMAAMEGQPQRGKKDKLFQNYEKSSIY